MDKYIIKDHEDLIGRQLGNYTIIKFVKGTSKSWLFEGRHERIDRIDAIKVLRPGLSRERENQFLIEGKKTAGRGELENLATIYTADLDPNYNLSYISFKNIPNEIGDLEDEINAGIKFSLEEILSIMTDSINAVIALHKRGETHGDIKTKHLKRDEKDNHRTYLLDLGARLSSKDYTGDIPSLGLIYKNLLDNCYEKIPKKLKQIIENCRNGEYKTIHELNNADEDYRKSISRRKFIVVSAIAALGAIGGICLNEYSKVHHKLEDIIQEIQSEENFNASLYEELLYELYRVKIDPLIETIPKDQFPLKVDESGKYQTAPNSYNDQGEWIRVIALGYLLTGDEFYLKEAIERNKFLKINRDSSGKLTEMDEIGINLNRIVIANTFLIDLIEHYKLEEYKGIKENLNTELQEVVNIFIENKYKESNLGGYFIMSSIDENLAGSNRTTIRTGAINIIEGMHKSTEKSLKEKIINFIRLLNKYSFRDDGSVRDAAIIDNQTGNFTEYSHFGYIQGEFNPNEKDCPKTCYNLTLMDLLEGMEDAYIYLNNNDKQITAKNLRNSLNFYAKNFISLRDKGFFEERFVLPIDFYDIRLLNKETWSETKINNYPLIFSLKILTNALLLPNLIEEKEFRNKINNILTYTAKNLTRCISTSKNAQGIIGSTADTKRHLGDDALGYYMYADANYLEYLSYLTRNSKVII